MSIFWPEYYRIGGGEENGDKGSGWSEGMISQLPQTCFNTASPPEVGMQ